MSKWILKTKKADFDKLSKELKVNPLIVRLLVNRNLDSKEAMESYLYSKREDMYSYELLDGIVDAVRMLLNKIEEGKAVRVIGDYDVDGICATAILLKGLKKAGAKVDYYIPKRYKDGYGLNIDIIEKAHEDKIDTILTCDNGIAAREQIERAKELSIDVIVTDHHEVPFIETDAGRQYQIPNANLLVDPKLDSCQYPYKEICGAVVAYKLIECLLDNISLESGDKTETLDELIQYAALATVSDVMPLLDENRIIVKTGLELMNIKPALAIEALASLNKLKEITSYHMGFVLGPSINAAGRLDDADHSLNLLMADNSEDAIRYATKLKELNESRKSLTEENTDRAIELVESSGLLNNKVLVLAIDDCHEGVLGIVAGRLKEKYNRPVLLATNKNDYYTGSARSIEGYNLFEEMSKAGDLFIKYGGHALAAGFSISRDNLARLSEILNENCQLSEEDMQTKLYIDADAPFSYFNFDIINEINLLEPFGTDNSTPVFARNDVTITSCRIYGDEVKVGKYKILDGVGRKFELTLFRRTEEFRQYIADKYSQEEADKLYNGETVNLKMLIAYYPKINYYNGNQNIQFIISDYL